MMVCNLRIMGLAAVPTGSAATMSTLQNYDKSATRHLLFAQNRGNIVYPCHRQPHFSHIPTPLHPSQDCHRRQPHKVPYLRHHHHPYHFHITAPQYRHRPQYTIHPHPPFQRSIIHAPRNQLWQIWACYVKSWKPAVQITETGLYVSRSRLYRAGSHH